MKGNEIGQPAGVFNIKRGQDNLARNNLAKISSFFKLVKNSFHECFGFNVLFCHLNNRFHAHKVVRFILNHLDNANAFIAFHKRFSGTIGELEFLHDGCDCTNFIKLSRLRFLDPGVLLSNQGNPVVVLLHGHLERFQGVRAANIDGDHQVGKYNHVSKRNKGQLIGKINLLFGAQSKNLLCFTNKLFRDKYEFMVSSHGKILPVFFILSLIAIFFCICTPALAGDLKVSLSTDKTFYNFTDEISVSVTISSTTSTPIGPLRVYTAILDSRGNAISYRNRYPGSVTRTSPKTINLKFDASKIKVSTGIYPLKVVIFDSGKEILTEQYFIIFAEKISRLEIVPFLNVAIPFRLNPSGALTSLDAENALFEAGREQLYLKQIAEGKYPAVVAVSNGTLIQLEAMSKGYTVKTRDGQIYSRTAGDQQPQKAGELLKLIKDAVWTEGVLVSIYPYGDGNPVDLINAELGGEVVPLYNMSQQFVSEKLELDKPPTIAYLPNRGISAKAVELLSAAGYLAAYQTDSSTASVFLSSNVPVIPVRMVDKDSATNPVELFKAVVSSHLKNAQAETISLDLNSIDPAVFAEFVELCEKYDFIGFTSSPPFEGAKPGKIDDVDSDYGDFNSLKGQFWKRYLETMNLKNSYFESLVNSEEEKTQLDNIFYISPAAAFNPRPDFDLSFSYIASVTATINQVFDGVDIISTPVSFTSRKARMPVKIANDSSKNLRVVLKLESSGAEFQKNDIALVLSSPETVLTIPVTLVKDGRISIKAKLYTPDGYLITEEQLAVTSNYRLALISIMLLVLVVMGLLVFLRRRMRSRKAAGL